MIPLMALPKPQIGQINFQTPKTRFGTLFGHFLRPQHFSALKWTSFPNTFLQRSFLTCWDLGGLFTPLWREHVTLFGDPETPLNVQNGCFLAFLKNVVFWAFFRHFFCHFFDPFFDPLFLTLLAPSVSPEIVPFQGTISSQIHMSF